MFSLSFGSTSTVCVCDPRHVCTSVTYFGLEISVTSKMRMPRTRIALTESGMPPSRQSFRPVSPSAETNRRLPYVDTSLCDAGQKYAVLRLGFAGFEMSHTCQPL